MCRWYYSARTDRFITLFCAGHQTIVLLTDILTLWESSQSQLGIFTTQTQKEEISVSIWSLWIYISLRMNHIGKDRKLHLKKVRLRPKKKSIELLSVSTHTGNLASVTRRLRGRGRLQVSFRDFHSSTLPATSKFPDQASVYTINVQWIKWNQ